MSLISATRAFLQISTSYLQEISILQKFSERSNQIVNQNNNGNNLQIVEEWMFMFNRINTSKEIKLIFQMEIGARGLS